jgi:hypothetical protein
MFLFFTVTINSRLVNQLLKPRFIDPFGHFSEKFEVRFSVEVFDVLLRQLGQETALANVDPIIDAFSVAVTSSMKQAPFVVDQHKLKFRKVRPQILRRVIHVGQESPRRHLSKLFNQILLPIRDVHR